MLLCTFYGHILSDQSDHFVLRYRVLVFVQKVGLALFLELHLSTRSTV